MKNISNLNIIKKDSYCIIILSLLLPLVLMEQRLVFVLSSVCLLVILTIFLRSIPRVAAEILNGSSAIRTLIVPILNPVFQTMSVKIMSRVAS